MARWRLMKKSLEYHNIVMSSDALVLPTSTQQHACWLSRPSTVDRHLAAYSGPGCV